MMTALPSSLTTIAIGSEVVLGAVDSDGVDWRIDSDGFTGWGATASSVDIVRKPRGPGAWRGDAYATERYLANRGTITAPTPELLNLALGKLNRAVSLDPTVFRVVEAGFDRYVMASRSDHVIPTKLTQLFAKYALQMVAEDSRKLGAELTGSTFLPATSGGLTIPFTIPFTINSTVDSGQVSLTNPGDEVGAVRLRIDGPCTGPVVTHNGSGPSLVFSSSLVLGAGEWIDIDMEKHEVLAQGQASRNGWVTGRGWSGFEPGPNTWSFTAAVFDPASKLTVYATPSWQ